MKAITYRRYGPPEVLQYGDVERPTPKDGQVLVRIRAAALNPLDWHFMRGSPFLFRFLAGVRRPKKTQLGVDGAGEVESVGSGVTRFKPGDAVFGAFSGAFAEYACTTESALAIKPDNITFESAAAVAIAAMTALQALRKGGGLDAGRRVLVNGAAGGVGTFAVQIARASGAQVTGVCSTRNVGLVRSLGAAHVVDYTKEDFTKSSERFDLIVDCVGNHSFSEVRGVLTDTGICMMVGGSSKGFWLGPVVEVIKPLILSRFTSQKFLPMLTKANRDDLSIVADLLRAGTVTPVIDRTYKLCETPEAIRYLETGRARGKIVIVELVPSR